MYVCIVTQRNKSLEPTYLVLFPTGTLMFTSYVLLIVTVSNPYVTVSINT